MCQARTDLDGGHGKLEGKTEQRASEFGYLLPGPASSRQKLRGGLHSDAAEETEPPYRASPKYKSSRRNICAEEAACSPEQLTRAEGRADAASTLPACRPARSKHRQEPA